MSTEARVMSVVRRKTGRPKQVLKASAHKKREAAQGRAQPDAENATATS